MACILCKHLMAKTKNKSRLIALVLILLILLSGIPDRKVYAAGTVPDLCIGLAASLLCSPFVAGCVGAQCSGPDASDGCRAQEEIRDDHATYEDRLMRDVSNSWTRFRDWLVTEFFRDNVLPALMLFTEQMSAMAMHQSMMIGMFLDAKHQLETQRLFQELQTEAHRDYHPSEDFCWFGTAVRSMGATEQLGRFNAVALSQIQMARQLGNVNNGAAPTRDDDKAGRWNQFRERYCDPSDNNQTATAGTGLSIACGSGASGTRRVNLDIDYTRAIDEPRTINANFTDAGSPTEGEQDVIALSSNLYGHDVLTRTATASLLKGANYQHLYLALRSVAAKRNVAMNSFNSIVGLKTAGTNNMTGGSDTASFLGALLAELGVPPGEVFSIIGNQPSYYAQLELIAKKIYQNPDFYANLYDKPANVERKGVALKAIELMLDRAIFESQLRQEMATSVLLSARLNPEFKKVENKLGAYGGGE